MALILRISKGSPLTFAEEDANFSQLANFSSGVHSGTLDVSRINGGTSANFVRGDGVYTNTLDGPLTATQTLVVSGAAATPRQLGFTTLGVARWNLYANTVAESGANAGSDLVLGRYSDGGVLIDNVFTVSRATGGITFNAPSSGIALNVTAAAAVSTVAQFNGSAGNAGYLILRGFQTGINFNGGLIITDSAGAGQVQYTGTANGDAIIVSGGAQRISISAGGNTTINAPASGVALSVSAFAGSSGITISGASTNAILSLSNTTSGNAYTDYTASGVRQFLVGTHRSSDEFRIVSGSSFDSGVVFAINNTGLYKFQSGAATKFIPGATSFALSNNANNADNLLVTDAGNVTIRLGITHGSATLLTTTIALTNGAAAGAGTITNAPAAGNPTKWVPINDNGTTRYIPAW